MEFQFKKKNNRNEKLNVLTFDSLASQTVKQFLSAYSVTSDFPVNF